MVASLLLALLAQAGQADAGGIRASLRCEPSSVEVGEPFELVLELSYPADTSVYDLGTDELALDDSWVLIDHHREPSAADGADPERRVAKRVWTLASLEPGARPLADAVAATTADERVGAVDAGAATVQVRGVLADGEDAPRPLKTFPPGFGAATASGSSSRLAAVLGIALALALTALAVVWRRARRRRAPVEPAGDPLQVLERLRAALAADADAARARHYELTALLRRTTDQRLGVSRDGLTDAEWLSQVRSEGRVPDELAREMEALFEEAEAVKYGGDVPTGWRIEETLARARRALEGLLSGKAPEPAGAGGGS